jgi:hypothetical protein
MIGVLDQHNQHQSRELQAMRLDGSMIPYDPRKVTGDCSSDGRTCAARKMPCFDERKLSEIDANSAAANASNERETSGKFASIILSLSATK